MHLKDFLNSFTKESNKSIIGIAFFVLILRYLGILESFELATYDFLFWLRPPETKDERIVIVAWDESQIQKTQETTMSDETLGSLLEVISKQQPRIIGLDLYRDQKVESPTLSEEQDRVAYQKLQTIFRSTPNLIGIEKVRPPYIKPPPAIQENNRHTASDLMSDRDNFIRRAFMFPLEDESGDPAGIPSFGFLIGYKYLEKEGFSASKIESNNALYLINPETKIEKTIEPLKRFDGSYLEKQEGTSVLINWRKQTPFTQVLVTQVLEGSVSPEIFHDKIVLIGNTAASTADRHYLPTNRWVKPQPSWTYGVEIHGQIISHLLSSVLDNRKGIETIPEWVEIGLIFLVLWLISLIAENYSQANSWRLFIITTMGSIVVLCILVWLSYLAFQAGYWLPIAPSLLGILVSPFIFCTTIYIQNIKTYTREIEAANQDFKRLLKDIGHSLKNPIVSLLNTAEFSQYLATIIEEDDRKKLTKIEEQLQQSPKTNLRENLDNILLLSKKIEYIRDNAQKYFGVAYFGESIFNKKLINFNELIKNAFRSSVEIKQIEYDIVIKIKEKYDLSISQVKLDTQSITRVIENLVDNAFYALKERQKQIPTHQCLLTIETIKKDREVQVVITDNGIGISEQYLDSIFLPFKSFRAKNKGQGLGLSLVKETLLYHQGHITVKSSPSMGSSFTTIFFLPKKE